LELVCSVDPHFRRPYWWGGFATTYRTGRATQAEFRESIHLLERGLEVFPTDWEIAWLLGLRYSFDVQGKDEEETRRNQELGASYMERAMRSPAAPADLPLLASSLRTKLGQKDRALRELREMILATTDPKTRKTLATRYAAMISEDASAALEQAAEVFDAEWQDNMPQVPPSLYVLLGPRPSRAIDLQLLSGERFLR
ncbi:MAG: hypothetical protein V2A73_05400, partial [Pseudomonadota bacterium]